MAVKSTYVPSDTDVGGSRVTRNYQLYQAGVTYNNELQYYDQAETNQEFYKGNQWFGYETVGEEDDLPKPVLNFISRFITFFTASLNTTDLKIHLSPYLTQSAPVNGGMTNVQMVEMVNSHLNFLLEKFKMTYKLRDCTFDAAITGDAALHFWFDPNEKPYGPESGETEGEINVEKINGVNVYYGNPNVFDKEKQPYILIVGRDTIDNLRREAIANGMSEFEAQAIVGDSDYIYQSSEDGRIEIDEIEEYSKALFIYCYRRDPETGTILVSKSTQQVDIFEEVDTGLTKYPIAWMNWLKQEDTYHGLSVATPLIETQIFINKMVAMVMLHLMLTAFPKIVYDVNAFPTGISSRVGEAIGLDNMSDKPIDQLINVLRPAEMSNQIIQALDTIIGYFKETVGINDASMGNIKNPDNKSALVAVQQATAVPLGNIAANMSEFMEDVGSILVDMMGAYYGVRPIMVNTQKGRQLVEFDFDQLKSMWLNVNCDVTQSVGYSEQSNIQTLSNLLNGQYIDFLQFLERVPDGYINDKQGLIDAMKTKIAQQEALAKQQAEAAQAQNTQAVPNMNKVLEQLSPTERQAFMAATPEQQQQLAAQLGLAG